jgi:hypothetical protein
MNFNNGKEVDRLVDDPEKNETCGCSIVDDLVKLLSTEVIIFHTLVEPCIFLYRRYIEHHTLSWTVNHSEYDRLPISESATG